MPPVEAEPGPNATRPGWGWVRATRRPRLVDGVEPIEVADVVAEVEDPLDEPGDRHDRHRLATPDGPRRHHDEREEEDADVTNEVFVVRAAFCSHPTTTEREVVEPRLRQPNVAWIAVGSMNTAIRARDQRWMRSRLIGESLLHRTPIGHDLARNITISQSNDSARGSGSSSPLAPRRARR